MLFALFSNVDLAIFIWRFQVHFHLFFSNILVDVQICDVTNLWKLKSLFVIVWC